MISCEIPISGFWVILEGQADATFYVYCFSLYAYQESVNLLCKLPISASIAQLGERQTEDLKVPGSIPGGGTHRSGSSVW